MITHIYVAKLRSGTPDEKVDAWLAAIRTLEVAGMSNLACGRDAGIREGNHDVAITADFEDEAAWRRYDEDPLHNRIRAEHARPIVEDQQRCQFEREGRPPGGKLRNVTMITLRPNAPAGQAELAAGRLAALSAEGMRHIDAGADLGFQPGNASAAVIADFDGAEGYHAYDREAVHNQIRRDDIFPFLDRVRRVQFDL